jgi:triosephosphate isomerase
MNTTVDEARRLASEIVEAVGEVASCEVVVCPPFVSLTEVRRVLSNSVVALGAQNLNAMERGAYTGEVSWSMLQGLCSHAIIGHSERRTYFHETDAEVNAKAHAALAAGLVPIVCVGERLDQRDAGQTTDFVSAQVHAALEGIDATAAPRLVIAYEPLWAIGTGRAANGADAQQVIAMIRAVVGELYNGAVAQQVRIQYGGSVTGANAAEFAGQPDIDGTLVGGASLKAADFAAIVAEFAAR